MARLSSTIRIRGGSMVLTAPHVLGWSKHALCLPPKSGTHAHFGASGRPETQDFARLTAKVCEPVFERPAWSAVVFNILRKRESSTTRSGVARTSDGCAIATIRRVKGGRHVLESCLSIAASPLEQTTIIASWVAGEGRGSGAIS